MSSVMDTAEITRVSVRGLYPPVKRVLDFVFAVMLLIVLVPLLLLIALAIRLDSPGPAIYRQERMGRKGSRFIMLKFRTMKTGSPVLSTEDMQCQQSIPFTRLGPALRKTSLDELPQLVNIARGEMSFIGPRPALVSQKDVNTLRARQGADCIRPGITGLAQVNGRDDLPADVKVSYDMNYCRKLSFLFDLRILAMTVQAIVSARGNK